MKYKKLGTSAVNVPVIGQGCMGLGGYFSSNTENDQQQIDTLKYGILNGMTLIDTAENYGAGHSEELVGKAVYGMRSDVFVATKVSPEHLSYHNVIASAENSLRRLKTDYIDLYQIHWPNPAVPVEETMQAMKTLVNQGKVRFVGVSNFYINALREAGRFFSPCRITTNQMEYNLFDRSIETDLLPYCAAESVSLIAYSPLDQGKFSLNSDKAQTLRRIGEKYSKTPAQICLAWLVAHPQVIVIPKTNSKDHKRENAQAADIVLSKKDIVEINTVFTNTPKHVKPNAIRVVEEGVVDRKVYTTLQEALENRAGFAPSPADLAKVLTREENIKPVRVVMLADDKRYIYGLVEGRIRYWAWVIAYGEERPIPVYLR
jgi:aryl-alcohol dehydrogenase-like predicted oxidoreductase